MHDEKVTVDINTHTSTNTNTLYLCIIKLFQLLVTFFRLKMCLEKSMFKMISNYLYPMSED